MTPERLRELLNYDPETGLFTWRVRASNRIKVGDVAGHIGNWGYFRITLDGKKHLVHRLAWLYVTGDMPLCSLDHINGIRTDNRFVNLREAPNALNHQNQRRARIDNALGALGVSPNRRGFRAQIGLDGRNVYIGYFRTPEEAHAAYLEAKRQLHEGCTI